MTTGSKMFTNYFFFSENQGHIDIIWIKMDLTYSLKNSECQMF